MNIGFSRNKHRADSQDGDTGAAEQADNNMKRLSANTNKTRSRLTVLKPRNKASFMVNAPKEIEQPEIVVSTFEKVDISTEPKIMTSPKSEPVKEPIIEKRIPEVVPQRCSDTNPTTIQIGFLNLNELNEIGEKFKKHDLPSWQLTAFDPQSGGAWISYSSGIGWAIQKDFLLSLSNHFESNKISTEQINFEVHYNSAILNKLRQPDTDEASEYLNKYFSGRIIVKNEISDLESELTKFHYLLEDDFYSSAKFTSVTKLLREAESFLIRYNYKENYAKILNLPPNQLICRRYGNSAGPGVLKFKPRVLKENQSNRAGYLVGLQMMAGMFVSMAGSVMARKNRIKKVRSIGRVRFSKKAAPVKSDISKSRQIKTTAKQATNRSEIAKAVDNKFEFISLKNVNWDKQAARRQVTTSTLNAPRNRQELIKRATELLAQKRSIAELKKTLPMTEGELSMLSRNITLCDKERIIQ